MMDERARFALVVATKDRPRELRRLLTSLAGQSRPPAEVVIVDGGRPGVRDVAEDPAFAGLRIRYRRCWPPSASRQRNIGLSMVGPEASWIGFADDDIVMASGALARMDDFLAAAEPRLGGAAFNQLNAPRPFASGMKRLRFVGKLGIYSGNPGEVMPSGFQVLLTRVERTIETRWLGSAGSVWRREIFDHIEFDEWFDGYSYLEDLDFSYRVGKSYRLVVVADAGYDHFHAPHGRGSGFVFGRREARNRVHFVRKNPELSLARCRLALALRAAISLVMAVREASPYYVARAAGTIVGLAQSRPWSR